jgi:(E)-4-hydroxy-3-methylbut-2-enyl-diphosphate synthase
MIKRIDTYEVNAGGVKIGGNNPISLQTMWKSALTGLNEHGFKHILDELIELKATGCDIIRFAVPDMESAEILSELSLKSPVPVVADIHFDHKLILQLKQTEYLLKNINTLSISV